MPTLESTLSRLAVSFTVRDIMTPNARLRCAVSKSEAPEVSDSNPDFDVIPILQDGIIVGYFERMSGEATEMTPGHLISDGTSILDLVEILEHRQFSFVLSRHVIDGYVHFSDLNHNLVKLTFYVILQALEGMAMRSLGGRTDRKTLQSQLDPQRFRQIENAYKRAGNAAQSFASYLNLSDMLKLADRAGMMHVENSLIGAMKEVRDGAAHVSENLVSSYAGVAKLANVKRECLRILGGS